MLALLLACASVVHDCGRCQALGGAWLPDEQRCVNTCEEQAEGVLCVEGKCPDEVSGPLEEAATCETCILLGGAWDGEACVEACEDCVTTRCPDGSG